MTPHDDDLTVHPADRPDDALDTECLGHYATLGAYLRSAVDPLFLPDGKWLLDCLDIDRVRGVFEADGKFRLRLAGGRVLRDRLRPDPAWLAAAAVSDP